MCDLDNGECMAMLAAMFVEAALLRGSMTEESTRVRIEELQRQRLLHTKRRGGGGC